MTAPEVPDPEAVPPLELREPLPPVVDTDVALAGTADALAHGDGPVALDAERASGYRYSARAYLVQVRRHHAGTALVDPVAFDDLSVLDHAIGDAEWILHAATQDLMCLADVGLRPRRLFDTELAGRLLNFPRVGLASLVQELLGYSLAKEHSAVDWSTRPLPQPWLEYAALDVEVLVELRDILQTRLADAGKQEWARQEFDALLEFSGPKQRAEPWRRTSGIHRVRGRRGLAVVRAVWTRRDELAAERDVAPGRILPDAAVVELASARPTDRASLRDLPSMRRRGARRYLAQWHDAVQAALALDEADLPKVGRPYEGPPPPRMWAEKDPAAAARLGRCREAIGASAEQHDLPVENLLSPDTVRRIAWDPPQDLSVDAVASVLAQYGAREWQTQVAGPPLASALRTM